jgi:hypothetical protein
MYVMRWSIVAVLIASFVASGASATGLSGLPAPITLYGVSGVQPGMTPAQVASRWGIDADTPGPGFNGCTGREFHVGSLHVTALFEHHRFSSASFEGTARTGNGIRVGSGVGELRRVFGSHLLSRRQPYAGPGTLDYFVKKPTKPYAWLYFSTSRNRVRTITYGNRSVFYEEGCA